MRLGGVTLDDLVVQIVRTLYVMGVAHDNWVKMLSLSQESHDH